MTRQTLFRVLVSAAAALLVAVNIYANFTGGSLPFTPAFKDADTAVVKPYMYNPLPAGLQDGDEIDLKALDRDTRSALLAAGYRYSKMAAGVTYAIVIRRAGGEISVPVTTAPALQAQTERHFVIWAAIYFQLVLLAVVFLTFWLGRDRAARFIGLWALAYIVGDASIEVPFSGVTLYYTYLFSWAVYILGRLALYVAAEALIGDALTAFQRLMFRTAAAVSLIGSLVLTFNGGYLLVVHGSAAWIHSSITWLVTTPYLVAALALVVAQRRALGAHRLRIQWMMWSLAPFTLGILARSIPAIGRTPAMTLNMFGVSIGVTGILYAILRHRVVDVRAALDRTLVYGATTSLVVGVIAAMNSLALKATLGEGAGLLLQIVVPLALGIVLGRVRAYMDRIVERVFFRQRYLTEKALRTFAKRCGHIEDMPKLLDAAVAELRKHTRSPAVALYELTEGKLVRLRSAGGDAYPADLDQDDPAVVALRAERRPVDLAGLESGLGSGGCVFPVSIVGRLRGVMVLADRPEERYGTDEKKLLAQVIREVGAAWRILRARDNEDLVRALARGTLEPLAARDRAQALEAGWAKA